MKWLLLVPILCILWPLLAHAQPARELAFPVVAADGIFDPSIADTPPGEQAWMSYSAVDLSPKWPEQNSRVTTRLAYSDDGGATWHDGGVRINGVSESLSGGKAISWNNEVSSLVYDPDAPSNAGWKLFWHHYAEIDGKRRFQHG